MRFRSTFRFPPKNILSIPMSPRGKAGRGGPQSRARAKSALEKELLDKILAASRQWQASGPGLKGVQQSLAESARRIFRASVAGIMVREHEGYSLASVSAAGKEENELLSRARSFASQALTSNQLLGFRFISRD